jgi:predicted transcriptional regulator
MDTSPHKIATNVTLPAAIRAGLDAEAARLDRSRSWITAQALRAYLERAAEHRDGDR